MKRGITLLSIAATSVTLGCQPTYLESGDVSQGTGGRSSGAAGEGGAHPAAGGNAAIGIGAASGAAGTSAEPESLPPGESRGLAGVYELTALDGYWVEMWPWLILTEVEPGLSAARVGEEWHNTVPAEFEWSEAALHVDVVGLGALGGQRWNTFYWDWYWTSFDLDLASDGTFSGTGVGAYSYDWSEEDIGGQGDEVTPIEVTSPVRTTHVRFVHPNGRESALPWDSPLRLEASRPMTRLANSFPQVHPDASTWSRTGERTAESLNHAPWDALASSEEVLPPLAAALDDAGRPPSDEGPIFSVFGVDAPSIWSSSRRFRAHRGTA